jgi:uncharacterized repeat protein (TIGR01451 family)
MCRLFDRSVQPRRAHEVRCMDRGRMFWGRRGRGMVLVGIAIWLGCGPTPARYPLWSHVYQRLEAAVASPTADLLLTKADSIDPVAVGQRLTYTMVITNNGPDAATGVTLTDPLPDGITILSATATQGNCTVTGSIVTCNLGQLTVGCTVTVSVVVTTTVARAVTNTGRVSGSEHDPNPRTNSATAVTTVLASCLGTGQALISGKVTAPGQRVGIPGAELTLYGPSGCASLAASDTLGEYQFKQLAEGRYRLTPAKTGCRFEPSSQIIEVSNLIIGVEFGGVCPP